MELGDKPRADRRATWTTWILIAAVLAGSAFVVRPVLFPGEQRWLRAAETAYVEFRYADAEGLANEHLRHFPGSPQALVIAGESAVKLQANQRSVDYFALVPDDGSVAGVRALYGRGNRLMRLGRVREAEACLRRVTAYQPNHLGAAHDLTYLLQIEGRTFEALTYLWRILRSGDVSGDHLRMVASTETISLAEWAYVEKCRQAVPDDPLPLLGRACQAVRNSDHVVARKLLDEILSHDPRCAEGQARLGRLLLDLHDDAGFQKWHANLPAETAAHPDIWVNRGIWAGRQGQSQAAARCFWEAVLLHPNHAAANHYLSQALSSLGDEAAAQEFAERARSINRLAYALQDIGESVEVFRKIAVELESLGRLWEAAGWYQVVLNYRLPPEWAPREFVRLTSRLSDVGESTVSGVCPASRLDLSTFPLPDLKDERTSRDSRRHESDREAPIRFANVAREAGINFDHYNGADPKAGRAYMFEFNGGGVAVSDFDNDGWPDLYFTQGSRWPVKSDDTTYRDRLFRNLGNGRFEDVTESAGLGDPGFSCGATVGDFDNDGWPDLYVGNIGANRMYHNNGDGTFTEVTALSGTAGDQWTTGAALADFNDDGLPDLYVLNYLAGPEVYEHACENNGRPVQCGPTLFRAEQDRLYVNLGDGRFQDVTESSGIVAPDGKGLGLLVADFDNSGRLGIFVANDTTANFLFRNAGGSPGQPPRFTEEGLLSGVAFDEHGRAQASMGIAAGDVNEDGRIDLFVTNFYRESNALYVQNPDHSFSDRIRPAGMFSSSFATMGWGAQFLDAQLDGLADLVLVNGHVNDLRPEGVPYHMPAQLFRSAGGERFEEVTPAEIGPYFTEPHLGRALARLDWNRDGREDFCATHVDARPALLENQSPGTGHFLALRLIGVQGERDAIGARLQLTAGQRTWHRQLTAGDGFQSSNQRQIVFGIGAEERIEQLKVQWRGGKEEVFKDLPVDAELVLVEGRSEPFAIPVSRPN